MEPRTRLLLGVTRLVHESIDAFKDYGRQWAAWQRTYSQVGLGTMIDHRQPGRQTLQVVALTSPRQMDVLGEAIGNVVHPLRVAWDRIERQKRRHEFLSERWPLPDGEGVWAAVRALDNHDKHEAPIALRLDLAAAEIAVCRELGGEPVGHMTAQVEQQTIPDIANDPEGLSIANVADIPKRFRRPDHFFRVAGTWVLVFASQDPNVDGRDVQQFLGSAMLAGTELIGLLEG